jgi:hypothetical protein
MQYFGFSNRKYMETWQEKADSLIRELQIEDKDLNRRIEVVIKNPEVLSPDLHQKQ